MEKTLRYPIGEQDFRSLRRDGCVYVDKTKYIAQILNSKNKYYFLARPRRFGKSLFLSSLRYFFEGERQLFKNLYIDSIDWEWKMHPVLRLDLNSGDYSDPGRLEYWIGNLLSDWEKTYKIKVGNFDLSTRFYNVIKGAYDSTGMQVVILVDEYDKPLVKNLNSDQDFEIYRRRLAALYSNFKTCAEYIRLVFITGVSRFSKLSIFSDLNNLNDITFKNDFADLCGITEEEMFRYFKSGIEDLARFRRISYDQACDRLKKNYDGYRFAELGSDIYNPWSLLNALSAKDISNYWNMTGIPTLIAESLRNINADLKKYLECTCLKKNLLGFDLKSADPTALLYQTGYLTIKDYDDEDQMFTLGVPNREVKEGLFDVLLPYYLEKKKHTIGRVVQDLVKSVKTGAPNEFMECLQAYFAGVPYSMDMDNEKNFHNAFYILATLLDLDTDAEVQTSDGRIDMLLQSRKYIFVVELKYNGTAQEALAQIDRKHYAMQWHNDPRTLFKIGASFSSETRTVSDWLIK